MSTDQIAPGFTRLADISTSEWSALDAIEATMQPDPASAMLELLRRLEHDDPRGFPVNVYEHCLQTATRALRGDESDEYVVAALFHDVGDGVGPWNHSEVAAALLRPFVSEPVWWMVRHHGLFQKRHFAQHPDWRPEAVDALLAPYAEHEHAARTVHFCAAYDAEAFDPAYDTLPLSAFEPTVRSVISSG
jgi:predicted HD phosphohydrolase